MPHAIGDSGILLNQMERRPMSACEKRFDYTYTAVNNLGVETEPHKRSGQPKVNVR